MTGNIHASQGRLSGRVAVVTGATVGMGAEIVRRYAAEGCRVVFSGRRESLGREVEREVRDAGGEALFVRADAANHDEIVDTVERAASEFGKITNVVNVAGATAEMAGLGDDDIVAFEQYLHMALLGAIVVPVVTAVPYMINAGGGAIVNVGSLVATRGTMAASAYVAAKGAQVALSRKWALAYAPYGIRCNTLTLGFVKGGPMTGDMEAQFPDLMAAFEAVHLLEVGEPADVADAAVWLGSDESRLVTGAVIPLDSGLSSYLPQPGTPLKKAGTSSPPLNADPTATAADVGTP